MLKTADIYHKDCPSRTVLNIISNKWVILIIIMLAQRPYRFGELKRQIGHVSPKVLTQLLKMLEKNGLINRDCYSVVPLKVEYTLTPLGSSLANVCRIISDWAENHIEQLGGWGNTG